MRILFLLTQDLESPSGLGRYLPLASELSRIGHHVLIIALHPDLNSLQQHRFWIGGVEVWYVAHMHVRKRGNEKLYYSSLGLLYLMLISTLKMTIASLRVDFDVVHIGKPHPMNSIAGVVAALVRRKDIYLDCDDDETGSGRFGNSFQKKVIAVFEKHMPRWVKAITTNTLYTRKRLVEMQIDPRKILYVSNGVDRQRFAAKENEPLDQLIRDLDIVNKRVIVYVGSLNLVNHPVDLLLQSLKYIADVVPEIVLLIIGSGNDYIRLQGMVDQMGLGHIVFFCGRISPDQIPLYYRLADVSVDPIYNDAAACGRSPLKLFESWAAAAPFVTADVGDRHDLAGDPPAVLLAKPGDAFALAQAILAVLQTPALADELRQSGRQRIQSFYWDRLVYDFMRIYEI